MFREKSFVASIRGFLIVLALSIHSLFEGMAIGKYKDLIYLLKGVFANLRGSGTGTFF